MSKNSLLLDPVSRTFCGTIPLDSMNIQIYSASFSPGYIGWPMCNSQRMAPKLHISIAGVYGIPNIISGAL